jgi:hypothetical protein
MIRGDLGIHPCRRLLVPNLIHRYQTKTALHLCSKYFPKGWERLSFNHHKARASIFQDGANAGQGTLHSPGIRRVGRNRDGSSKVTSEQGYLIIVSRRKKQQDPFTIRLKRLKMGTQGATTTI